LLDGVVGFQPGAPFLAGEWVDLAELPCPVGFPSRLLFRIR
jgi:hypothetical protein